MTATEMNKATETDYLNAIIVTNIYHYDMTTGEKQDAGWDLAGWYETAYRLTVGFMNQHPTGYRTQDGVKLF